MTRAQAEEWAVIFHTRLGILDAIPGHETKEEIDLARKEADQAIKKLSENHNDYNENPHRTMARI